MASQTPEQQILPSSLTGSGVRTLTRSAKRFTPYRSVIASRRRSVTQPVRAHEFTPTKRRGARTPSVSLAQITADIVNKTWRLYRSSPLYNLSYRPAHLKAYGKALSVFIESECHKGFAVAGTGSTTSRLVEVTSITSLRSSADDRNALKIVIKDKPAQNGKTKAPLLTAYLCCVEVGETVSQSVSQEFAYLPLVLVKGPVALSRLLIEFLQKRFDCVIRELNLSSGDLQWLFVISAGYVPDKLSSKPVTLLYLLGDAVPGVDKITFSIDAKDCQRLVHSVCGEESEDLGVDQKERIVRALEEHFFEHFKLNLNRLKLQRIATAVSVVGADGRLKIYSSEHVLQVLSFLTTLCCEHFEKVTGVQTSVT